MNVKPLANLKTEAGNTVSDDDDDDDDDDNEL
jgi:hypothetical protein